MNNITLFKSSVTQTKPKSRNFINHKNPLITNLHEKKEVILVIGYNFIKITVSKKLKKMDNTEIDINLNDFPDELVKLIEGLLDDKNYSLKHDARNTLVKMGKRIVPQMHRLLASKNILLRKNAAKVIELIADRRSIPLLIDLLNDKESDIRWIAAEGLIKIGRRSISPLLKSIRGGKSSLFHNKGAHQVLNSLLDENEKVKFTTLLLSLNDYHELGETAPVEASKVLKIR